MNGKNALSVFGLLAAIVLGLMAFKPAPSTPAATPEIKVVAYAQGDQGASVAVIYAGETYTATATGENSKALLAMGDAMPTAEELDALTAWDCCQDEPVAPEASPEDSSEDDLLALVWDDGYAWGLVDGLSAALEAQLQQAVTVNVSNTLTVSTTATAVANCGCCDSSVAPITVPLTVKTDCPASICDQLVITAPAKVAPGDWFTVDVTSPISGVVEVIGYNVVDTDDFITDPLTQTVGSGETATFQFRAPAGGWPSVYWIGVQVRLYDEAGTLVCERWISINEPAVMEVPPVQNFPDLPLRVAEPE